RLLASSHGERLQRSVVRLWEAGSGRPLRTIPMPAADFSALAFAPDGRSLAWAGDEVIRLLDPGTGARRQELVGHTSAVTGIAFAPSGRVLASGGLDSTIRLWDPQSGKLLATVTYLGPADTNGPGDWVVITPAGR